VNLVPYGGNRAVFGFNNLVDGPPLARPAKLAKPKLSRSPRSAAVPRRDVEAAVTDTT
jgi:hypothetical protein